jgi:hypothetical protein
MKHEEATAQPAPLGQVERGVGRLCPQRDIADYEYGDDDWLDDEPACERCHGDGMDPMCDHLLPCPACQGEQRP